MDWKYADIHNKVRKVFAKYNLHITEFSQTSDINRGIGFDYRLEFQGYDVYPFLEMLAALDEPQFATVTIEPPKECDKSCEKCINHKKVNADMLFCDFWHNFTEPQGYCYKFEAEKPVDNSA